MRLFPGSISVRDSQVHRFDELRGAKVPGEPGVEAGVREVALVTVGRDRGSFPLERGAIPNRAVADADSPGLELQVARREHARLRLQDEHLFSPSVDDRNRPRGTGRKGVERRDSGHGNLQSEREPTRGGEADPQPREAARPRADREPLDVSGPSTSLAQESIDVLQDRHGA